MKRLIPCLILLLTSCDYFMPDRDFASSQLDYIERISVNDVELGTPKSGEWLFEHKETGQSFVEYKSSKPIRPTNNQSTIYLVPIGDFSSPIYKSLIEEVRKYVEIYFQQKTVLLPAIQATRIPQKAIRNRGDYKQWLAPYILDSILKGNTPKDGIALMALSEKDLYPNKEWNFVFGLASYRERVGVSSIARLYENKLTDSNFTICLRRICQVATHEIGHMMSIKHCTHAACVMNGSNGLYESDNTPNRLCSVCQKKLIWNFKFDPEKRLKDLIAFFKRNNMIDDRELLERDLN